MVALLFVIKLWIDPYAFMENSNVQKRTESLKIYEMFKVRYAL